MAETKTAVVEPTLTPPPGFKFNPDVMSDYDEQVRDAIAHAAYQAEPLPSFEDTPRTEITPTFNPTGAPEKEIYGRDRVPKKLRELGTATHAELANTDKPVTMWRIVERSRVVDGTGLVSSSILHSNTLGDLESVDPVTHLSSNHEGRMSGEAQATPFVSFSTDPQNLAKDVILKRGFGVREGRDPVVVQVEVAPDRVLTKGESKEPEVLLIGGTAPEEFVAAYEVGDFISTVVPEDYTTTLHGQPNTMRRDEVLQHWSTAAPMAGASAMRGSTRPPA